MGLTINTVILGGHLTRDPEVRRIGEQAVANFGIAMNHRSKGPSGEPKETVVFVDLEAWGRTAELVGQYLTKGSACVIEGRLKLDSWQDQDGKNRSKLKVVAEKVQFVGHQPRGEGEEANETQVQQPVAAPAPAKPTRQTGPAPAATATATPSRPVATLGRPAQERRTEPQRQARQQTVIIGEGEPPF